MKTSFQLLAMMLLAVMPGVSLVGCDSRENADQPAVSVSQIISYSELEKAAAADIAITDIDYQLYLDAKAVRPRPGYDEIYRLWLEAHKEKAQALENVGLDLKTYNNIMAQVRLNEQVDERFQKKVQSIKPTIALEIQ
jgi:hypothetical protein